MPPTDVINEEYGEPVPSGVTAPNGEERLVYTDKIPVTLYNTINPENKPQGKFAVKPIEVPQPNGTYRKAFFVDKDNNLVGWGGSGKQKTHKVIGREDSRVLYINSDLNTKQKLKLHHGVVTKPNQTIEPKTELGTGGWKKRAVKK